MKKLLAVLTVCTMFLCAAASCGSGSSYGGDPAKAIQENDSESSSIIGRWEADDETLRNASEGKAVSVKKCILEFTEDGKYIVDSETDSSDLLCIKDDGIYIKGRKADQYTYNGKTLTVGDLILERVDTVEASSLYGRYKRADNSNDYIYDFESSGGASDASFVSGGGTPIIDACGPHGDNLHNDQEYFLLDTVEKRYILIANLIRRLLSK